MKRIIGNSGLIQKDRKFYDLATQFDGENATEECRRKHCTATENFFSLLPNCPELHSCQTLSSWKFEMLTCKINRMFVQRSLSKPKLILYFIPIGPFPDFIHNFKHEETGWSLFDLLGNFLKIFFPGSVLKYLPEINITDIPARKRNHELTGKLQYHVSDILVYLQKMLPRDGFAIIGLSWSDMYPCEKLNFILGQGSYQHSACVSSFGRFDPNFVKGFKGQEEGITPEEMKDVSEIDGNLLWKLMKVLSHETCHVVGLSHCTVFECAMNESHSSHEALSQPLYLCPLCMSKIQHLQTTLRTEANLDDNMVKSHLSSILDFLRIVFTSDQDSLTNQKFENTIKWFQSVIDYLGE